MATQPDIMPDVVTPQSPPEIDVPGTPDETPDTDLPGESAPAPDYDQPDSAPSEMPVQPA